MKKSLVKLLVLFFLLGSTAAIQTGCNTTEGFGRDVERAGEGIQDAVN